MQQLLGQLHSITMANSNRVKIRVCAIDPRIDADHGQYLEKYRLGKIKLCR